MGFRSCQWQAASTDTTDANIPFWAQCHDFRRPLSSVLLVGNQRAQGELVELRCSLTEVSLGLHGLEGGLDIQVLRLKNE